MISKKVKGIYIHVPFCTHICSYCAFCKVLYNKKMADGYLNSLIKDLDKDDLVVDNVYIGGGSPSSLDETQLELLLTSSLKHYSRKGDFCIEINPEDMNDSKISLLKKYHVNRVSIGVQSFNNKYLLLMNRHHNKEMVKDVINKLRKIGINNINIDLIFGLPNQKESELIDDISEFIKLDVPHISTYALQIENNTLFKINKINALNDDLQANQFDLICQKLKEAGYIHYEVSNFSKEGFESKQNLLYWKDECYRGVGVASSGYEDDIRYDTSYSLSSYIKGNINKTKTIITKEEEEFEYIMLNLRLKDGFSLAEFKNRFGFDFLDKYKSKVDRLVKDDLLCVDNKQVYVKENKLFILNSILVSLLEDIDY